MPTRIAFCITELDPGGAEWALVRLLKHLDQTEWEPRVDCLGPPARLVSEVEALGIPVTCYSGRGIRSAWRVAQELTRNWREWQPDLVQTMLFHANIIGRIAARRAGVRIVCSGLRVAERRSCWHGHLDRLTNGLVDRNVCVSRGVADWAEREVGLSPAKTIVIPNGIDVERFAGVAPTDLTALGIPTGSQVVLAIGRLDPQKGYYDLLTAFALIAARHERAHLVIIGDGPLRGGLEARRADLGLTARVHFPGRRDDVPGLLAACDVFVLASHWEGMPNVVLEAMAAGRPIVATRVEGVAELLSDRESGLLVPHSEPALLGRALERLLDEPGLARHFGKCAQSVVNKSFAESVPAIATSDLYRTLLGGKLAGR